LSLVDGVDLVQDGPLETELLGFRRGGDHLFLRYRLDTIQTDGSPGAAD
jgi:hypothetical protein